MYLSGLNMMAPILINELWLWLVTKPRRQRKVFFNLVASCGLYFHVLIFLRGYIAGSVALQHTADRPDYTGQYNTIQTQNWSK